MGCVHHWNLDVVPAKCRYCGDEKVFPGVRAKSFREIEWERYEIRHAITSSKHYPVDF